MLAIIYAETTKACAHTYTVEPLYCGHHGTTTACPNYRYVYTQLGVWEWDKVCTYSGRDWKWDWMKRAMRVDPDKLGLPKIQNPTWEAVVSTFSITNLNSCLYIPWCVPNTCGFSVISGGIFIAVYNESWMWNYWHGIIEQAPGKTF